VSLRALEKLRERFGESILETHSQHGDDTAVVDAAKILEVAGFLRDDAELKFDMLIDLTALDALGLDEREGGRFEIVYHFRSSTSGRRVRVKARVDEGPNEEHPEIDSLVPLWKGANWFEREVWDMYGVKFRGHPDLRRILMYEEFVGHPLRKDYPKERRQPLVRRDYTT
jgi:NADH-quinone oxidoreductase subunit C